MTDKERFCEILKATGRAGVDKVLAGLEELGFFTAPASTRFHGSEPGGLLAHSLNAIGRIMAAFGGCLALGGTAVNRGGHLI